MVRTFNGLPQFNPPVNGITPAPPTNPGCDPTITDECVSRTPIILLLRFISHPSARKCRARSGTKRTTIGIMPILPINRPNPRLR